MVFESRIINENYVLLLNPVVSRSITTLFSWTSFRWSIFANPGFGTASGMVWMPTCSDSPTSEDIQIVLNLCKGSNKSLINPKTRVCNIIVLYLNDVYLLHGLDFEWSSPASIPIAVASFHATVTFPVVFFFAFHCPFSPSISECNNHGINCVLYIPENILCFIKNNINNYSKEMMPIFRQRK